MDTLATTTHGRVRGRITTDGEASAVSFLGIPFAAPPTGARRFAPPAPAAPWTDERDALLHGPSPPQLGGALLDLIGTSARGRMDEDCLTINVTTPGVDDARRPVMVWIHGGAFVSGTSDAAVYDGTRLCLRGDVVVVTFNYRVGALGWLHLPAHAGGDAPASGNLGLLDQIAALRWVRDNAAAFGGDPDRVTVFGESAGAGSLGALLAAPAARGLFGAAILQSGAPDGYLTPDEAAERTDRFLATLGVAAASLGEVPVAALLEAQQKCAAERIWKTGMFFTPVVDGEILPERPLQAVREGRAAPVPLVIGTTRDELQLYKYGAPAPTLPDPVVAGVIAEALPGEGADAEDAARQVLGVYRAAREARGESLAGIDLVYAFQTDLAMRGPAIRMAEHHRRRGHDVFMYLFDWTSPVEGGALGACHALDVPFTFGALDVPGVSAFTGAGPAARAVSDQLMDAWLAFARSGRPAAADGAAWPGYDEGDRATMTIGASPGVVRAPREPEREALAGALDRTLP